MNQAVRELTRLDYFWTLVAREKGVQVPANVSPFTAFFVACFRAERDARERQRLLDAQLVTAVRARRWVDATAAVAGGANPNVIVDASRNTLPLDETREFYDGYHIMRQDGVVRFYTPAIEQFIRECIKAGGRIGSSVGEEVGVAIIESATFSLDADFLFLARRMKFTNDNPTLILGPAPFHRGQSRLVQILLGASFSKAESVLLAVISRSTHYKMPLSHFKTYASMATDETREIFFERCEKLFPHTSDWIVEERDRLANEKELARLMAERALARQQAEAERTNMKGRVQAVHRRLSDVKDALDRAKKLITATEELDASIEEQKKRLDDDYEASTLAMAQATIATMERAAERFRGKTERRELAAAVGRGAAYDVVKALLVKLLQASESEAYEWLVANKEIVTNDFPEDDDLILQMLATQEETGIPDFARNMLIS